jgi:hypothetical protein
MSPVLSPPPVAFTTHSVQRFVDRMRPGRDLLAAQRDLEQMRAAMTFTTTPPAWLQDLRYDADAFLVLGDAAFVLRPCSPSADSWRAVTCLVRGVPSDATRERRLRHRRAANASRRSRKAHSIDHPRRTAPRRARDGRSAYPAGDPW